MAGDPRPKSPKPPRRRGWNTTLPATSKRLPPMSDKRRAEDDERRAVRAAVRARAGGRCEARHVVPEVTCRGPLDVDEVESRGAHPGAHLDVDLCQLVCRAHHDWRHAEPDEATERGLRRTTTYELRMRSRRGDFPCSTCGLPGDDWCPVCHGVMCDADACKARHAGSFDGVCDVPQ